MLKKFLLISLLSVSLCSVAQADGPQKSWFKQAGETVGLNTDHIGPFFIPKSVLCLCFVSFEDYWSYCESNQR
jgi:hypothetical protein